MNDYSRITAWQKAIEYHNKAPQRTQIRNRNQVVIVPRSHGFHAHPVVLYPQGTWTKDGKRFIGDPNLPFDVNLYHSTLWRVDPVARTLAYGLTGWGSYNAKQSWAVTPKGCGVYFRHADRWSEGVWIMKVNEAQVDPEIGLVLHEDTDGRASIVEGATPAIEGVLTDENQATLKRVRARLREIKDTFEPLRISASPDHDVFGKQALRTLHTDTTKAQKVERIIEWALSDLPYDPVVHAMYVLVGRGYGVPPIHWPADYAAVDRVIRRAIVATPCSL